MHSHSITPWTHGHAFPGAHHRTHERRMWSVVALTAVMMVAEIAGGALFGSIALVADGWHMATHVAALAIAGLAYLFARRHADDARFSLGTGKFGELAAFASAVILGMIALGVGYESVLRLIHPVAIRFGEAIPIAALGLCVISPAPGCCATTMTMIARVPAMAAAPIMAIPIFARLTCTCSPMR